jgi:hypothetical protein
MVRRHRIGVCRNRAGAYAEGVRTGRSVINLDCASAKERRPLFAPLATDAGFRWVHALLSGSSTGENSGPAGVPIVRSTVY